MLFPLDACGGRCHPARAPSISGARFDDLPPGNERLRRQIGKRYLTQGLAVAADEIVLTNGALEALNLCLQAVARPGDAVVVESPSFYAALQSLERLQLKAIEVPTHPREGVDLSDLARILETQRPKACWLMTNFQNPLGCSLSREKKHALVDLLSHHEVPLIEDDVYGELHHTNEPSSSAKTFDQRRPRDALLVVLQDAVTGLPSRVGRGRPVCQQRAPVEAHDQSVGLDSGPGRPGRVFAARWL